MDAQIKALQDYLKTSPLGIIYSGSNDGVVNDQLKQSTSQLEAALKSKLSGSDVADKIKSLSILAGDKVNVSIEDLKLYVAKTVQQPQAQPQIIDQNIKQVQSVINSNPFGIKYSGAVDGIMNNELSSKLSELEGKIKEVTGADASGKIISENKLTTNSGELSKTFDIINKFLQQSKSEKLNPQK